MMQYRNDVMNIHTFLTESKATIVKNWLAELEESSSVYGRLSYADLVQYCHTFLNAFMQTIQQDDSSTDELTRWAIKEAQIQAITLADIDQFMAGLRRTFIKIYPTEIILQLFGYLDKGMTEIIKTFTFIPEQALKQQMADIEAIARDLATANEDTDWALIRLQSLYDVSRQLSTDLNVAKIMEQALACLVDITYAQSGMIWLRKENRVDVQSDQEISPPIMADLLTHFALQATEMHKQGLVVTHSTKIGQTPLTKHLFKQFQATTLILVPLLFQEDIIGVVSLHGNNGKLKNDLDVARSVGQQTAVALRNGQFYEEVQHLNQNLEQRIDQRTHELANEKERLATMYQISARLAGTLDINQLLEQTLKNLAATIGAHNGVILLNEDAYSNEFFCKASLDQGVEHHLVEKTYAPLSRWMMSHRQSLVSDDLHSDNRWQGNFNGTRSAVAAPLKVDTDLHGILLLTDPMTHQFTTSHMRLVEAVAAQLAAAVDKGRMHNYIQEQVVRLGTMLRTQAVETGQKQAILSSIVDGVIASDNKGAILLVNPAAEEILGQTDTSLVGQSVNSIFNVFETSGQQAISKVLDALQKESTEEGIPANEMKEVMLEIDHKVISARLSGAYTSTMERIGVVTVLRDITKEVEADRAKTEFITTVSHELRTPMTSIIGYTEMLSQEAMSKSPAQQKKFLAVVRRNANRLSTLINDLLDVSRIESGRIQLNKKEIKLGDLSRDVVEALIVTAEKKNLRLAVTETTNFPTVCADPNRITQVLTNLVNNAILYTEAGSVLISLETKDDMVVVNVQDTGIGINEQDIDHIFDRFFRSEHMVVQANSGTGLGLPIVKSFVEMHNGRIWVDSTPGKGSTFSFILPISG